MAHDGNWSFETTVSMHPWPPPDEGDMAAGLRARFRVGDFGLRIHRVGAQPGIVYVSYLDPGTTTWIAAGTATEQEHNVLVVRETSAPQVDLLLNDTIVQSFGGGYARISDPPFWLIGRAERITVLYIGTGVEVDFDPITWTIDGYEVDDGLPDTEWDFYASSNMYWDEPNFHAYFTHYSLGGDGRFEKEVTEIPPRPGGPHPNPVGLATLHTPPESMTFVQFQAMIDDQPGLYQDRGQFQGAEDDLNRTQVRAGTAYVPVTVIEVQGRRHAYWQAGTAVMVAVTDDDGKEVWSVASIDAFDGYTLLDVQRSLDGSVYYALLYDPEADIVYVSRNTNGIPTNEGNWSDPVGIVSGVTETPLGRIEDLGWCLSVWYQTGDGAPAVLTNTQDGVAGDWT